MIHRNVFHNGKLGPIEQVRLSPGQAGLLNGWGLFTTLRIFDGLPFAFERHWRRLQKDAQRTRLTLPFDEAQVRAHVDEVLRANNVKEGCARIYVVQNRGFWASGEEFPDVDLIIYTSELPAYREPVRLGLAENGRHAASPLAGVKVTSWLNNVWHLQEATRKGFDEVVLLNERSEVAECTAANIFCVQKGKAYTPPLSSGCLEGVTRGVLLEIGTAAGISVEERTIRAGDLFGADEVFITSTNRSVLAVGEVAGNKIPVAPGPVTQKLEQVFMDYVQNYLAKAAATR